MKIINDIIDIGTFGYWINTNVSIDRIFTYGYEILDNRTSFPFLYSNVQLTESLFSDVSIKDEMSSELSLSEKIESEITSNVVLISKIEN